VRKPPSKRTNATKDKGTDPHQKTGKSGIRRAEKKGAIQKKMLCRKERVFHPKCKNGGGQKKGKTRGGRAAAMGRGKSVILPSRPIFVGAKKTEIKVRGGGGNLLPTWEKKQKMDRKGPDDLLVKNKKEREGNIAVAEGKVRKKRPECGGGALLGGRTKRKSKKKGKNQVNQTQHTYRCGGGGAKIPLKERTLSHKKKKSKQKQREGEKKIDRKPQRKKKKNFSGKEEQKVGGNGD